MPESPVDTVAFALAWIFLETAIPMIIPNRVWAGIVMAIVGLTFLASALGWLPSVNRALAWKYSLLAFVVAGAGFGVCAWELIPRPATPITTVEQYQNRKSTDPFLVGNMATSLGPAKNPKEMLVQFKVTVSNRGGMASVVKRWDFNWECGNRKSPLIIVAPMYRIDKDAEPAFGLVDQQASNKIVIPLGGEAYYTLRYTIPVSANEIKQNGLHLGLTFWDVMDHASEIEEHFDASRNSN
jgi:hypothetical protein